MATPSSQKADQRPISFVLSNEADGSVASVTPPIRPEDLTRSEPSLMTPVMTFGGAYVEDFGPGIATIQISGTTGWRGGETEDGVAAFKRLHDLIWTRWHADRLAAVESGRAPDVVKLIFSDGLDDIVNVVVPGAFALKRNKARPLLMQYQISMTVLSDRIDQPTLDPLRLTGAGRMSGGIDSVLGSISRLQAAARNARSWLSSSAVGPVRDFLAMSTSVFRRVTDLAGQARGLIDNGADALVSISTDLAQVGRNAFYTYNAVAGLPTYAQHQAAAVAAAYENVFCVLRNVFRIERQYPDYTSLYGASVCSSTIGGTPLSAYQGQNPFDTIIPGTFPPPAVSAGARAALEALKFTDPVLSPMTVPLMAGRLADINAGVVFP